MKKRFGNRLRTLRQLASLTQSELAEMVGISDRYLGRMERGLVSPSFDCIEKIARVLHTPPAGLFLFPFEEQAVEPPPSGQSSTPLTTLRSMGLWEFDRTTSRFDLSPEVMSLTDYVPSSAAQGRKKLLEHVVEEDRHLARALMDALEEGRSYPPTVLSIRRKDGSLRHMLFMAHPAGGPGSSRMIGLMADMTDQMRSEELLHGSMVSLERMVLDRSSHLANAVSRLRGEMTLRADTERSLRLAARERESLLAGLDGVFIKHLTPDYTTLWANKALTEAFGVNAQDLVGRTCYKSALNRETPCPGCPVPKTLATGEPADGELTIGNGKTLLTRSTPVMDDDGSIASVLFVGLDVTDRVRTRMALDEAIQERAALLRGISGMTIKYVDKDMRLAWVSTSNPDSPVGRGEDCAGRYCHEAFQGLDTPCPGCPLPDVLETGAPFEGEITPPSGRTSIVRVNPVFGADGAVKAAVHMALEITQRKAIEESLNQAKLFLEHLLGTCAAVVFTAPPGSPLTPGFMSGNVQAVLGYPPEAFVDAPGFWESCLFPGERDRLLEALPVLERDGSLGHELRFRHADGSWRWIRLDLRLTGGEGTKREIVGSLLEVTDSKACELALKESEFRFRRLFTHNHTVQLFIDADSGLILDANKAASDYYGYPLDTLKRMNIMQINTQPEDQVVKEIEKVRLGEKNIFRFHHRLQSGEIRDVEVRITFIELGGRSVTHALIIDLERDTAR